MIVTFFDRDDEESCLNGTIIKDNARLFQILEGLRTRLPFFCELMGENGFCLLIGIGEVGCAQYSRCDGRTPYLMATIKHQRPDGTHSKFLMAGTSTPISGSYCLPFDCIREIAGHFRQTGAAHPAYVWEAI